MWPSFRFPILDPGAVKDESCLIWRLFLPLVVFFLPLVPFVSFRSNSWFSIMLPLGFLVSFGPQAFLEIARQWPRQYVWLVPVFVVGLISALLSKHALNSTGVLASAFLSLISSALIYVVVAAAPSSARVRSGYTLIAGCIIAMVIVPLLHRRIIMAPAFHGEDGINLYGYNRGMVTLVLFLPVVLAFLYHVSAAGFRLFLPAAMAIGMVLVAWQSISETAKVVVFVAIAMYVLGLISLRWSIWTTVFGISAMFVIWPIVTPLAYAAFLDGRIALPHFGSAQERLGIWAQTSRFSLDAIWFGHGPHALKFDMLMQDIVRYVHPHSGIGQTWLDLGIFGVITTMAALFAIVASARSKSSTVGATLVACTTAVCAANTVSHGLWQSWWLGTAGVLPILVMIVESAEAADRVAPTATVASSTGSSSPA